MSDPLTPADINTTAVYLLLGRLEKMTEGGFDGIHHRLDQLNGRVSSAEKEIAVLKDRAEQARVQAVAAKDRAEEVFSSSENMKGAAKWWSVGLSSAIVGIIELVRQYYGGGK